MDRTHKIIAVLLVLAIILSTISVVTSLIVLNFDLPFPGRQTSGTDNTISGQVAIFVEKNPNSGAGG